MQQLEYQNNEQEQEPEEEKLPKINEKELEEYLLEAAREEHYLKLNMENE